jgi:murein DD-endopeptidase MepM/ murein hydrolase activator NlpD
LSALNPELILACQTEGAQTGEDAWIDLLANRSSINETKRVIDFRRKILKRYRGYFQAQAFCFPVQGNPWYSDTYGADREGGARQHEGTDLFSAEGTPILNAADGWVEKLGWNRLGGERVGVRGNDGNYYYYAHLKELNPQLRIGQKIAKGASIGWMGHTGDAITTPDHLHFGIQLPNEEWMNPYTFLVIWQHYRGDS